MRPDPPEVPDAELAVLNVLWAQGPCTIRQLTEALYPEATAAKYATVQKLLERLEAKRCVRRDRSRLVHVFEASIDREALIGHRVRKVAEKLCGGSMTRLVTHLVRHESLTPKELKEIRAIVAAAGKTPKQKRRK